MKKRAFHFEIKNLLTQFIAAFDDVVISRWNKDRSAKSNIEVRYVFAPKHRVMYDIINKAQNITLPAVAVDLTSISRDESRVFNKLAPSYMPADLESNSSTSSKFLMPVPVNLEVSMSILARYMEDVDQIISNFAPYNNPYIVLSWPVPKAFGTEYDQEIRSEVLWSGELAYNTPTDTTYSDKFRITVDTSFTIKGWLFPEKKNTQGTIYKVDSNFVAVDLRNRIYNPLDRQEVVDSYQTQGYEALSGYNDTVPTNYSEMVTVSGRPEFTNIFYTATGDNVEMRNEVPILSTIDNSFLLLGKRFNYSNNFYLSSENTNNVYGIDQFFSNYQAITSGDSNVPTISGYKLNDSNFTVSNGNIVSFYFPANTLSGHGRFTLVTANEAGWATSYQATSSIIHLA
jgi:hypothetical protein|tara:strand:+ start:655 stop:1854 length:1200 start_codon:yes stop_codon:yes gene_type:complete